MASFFNSLAFLISAWLLASGHFIQVLSTRQWLKTSGIVYLGNTKNQKINQKQGRGFMHCLQVVAKQITIIEFARLLRKQGGRLTVPVCSVANHAEVPGEFILTSKFEQENENESEWRM